MNGISLPIMRLVVTTALIAVTSLLHASTEARPYSTTYKDKYAEVDFSWPDQVSKVPALVKRFRSDFVRERVKSIKCGKAESDVRIRTGDHGIRCSSSTRISASGETPRLLSLAVAYWAFTGGAHGNGAIHGLLWDRKLSREINFASLFTSLQSVTTIMRDGYCRALAAERKRRRAPHYKPGSIAEFDSCPMLLDLALIPANSASNRPFDQIHLVAAPYQVGSYAEGEYDIALSVSARLIAAMKPAYRSSFSAQRQ